MEGYGEQAKVNQDYYDQLRRSAQAQQNVAGQFGALGAVPSVAPPRTLASAMSGLDALNKRLAETTNKALQLATMIGGPVPATGGIQGNTANPAKPSAMQGLNDSVTECHGRVDAISTALDAMARSLGTIDG